MHFLGQPFDCWIRLLYRWHEITNIIFYQNGTSACFRILGKTGGIWWFSYPVLFYICPLVMSTVRYPKRFDLIDCNWWKNTFSWGTSQNIPRYFNSYKRLYLIEFSSICLHLFVPSSSRHGKTSVKSRGTYLASFGGKSRNMSYSWWSSDAMRRIFIIELPSQRGLLRAANRRGLICFLDDIWNN